MPFASQCSRKAIRRGQIPMQACKPDFSTSGLYGPRDFQILDTNERKRLNMKNFCIAAVIAGLFVMSAAAQTSAGGSASGSASVTPGQASAGANASQSAQAPGASANVNGGANAQASQSKDNKKRDDKGSAAAGSNSAAGVNGASGALSSGTTLQAELTKSLDAKKAQPGDEVTAKLTQDVKGSGQVVLHKGTKIVGHVTEAQAKTKENSESKLGIVFDKAVLKGGEQMSFNGVIQAMAAPVQGTVSAGGDEAGNLGGGMGSGGGTAIGGGRSGGGIAAPLGGAGSGAVNSTLGSATNTVNNTTGSVAGSATGAVNGSVNQATGVAANGAINSATRGVVGMQGIALNTAAAGSAQGSVISSASRNVKLDSGTQMVLQVTGAAAAQ